MRSKFTDQTMIFAKEVNGRTLYSTSIGRKNVEGEWENASILVNFPKGTQIANKTIIDIKNGWLSFYPSKGYKKDGTEFPDNKFYIFCNEFEILDAPEAVEGFTQLSEDSIPF